MRARFVAGILSGIAGLSGCGGATHASAPPAILAPPTAPAAPARGAAAATLRLTIPAAHQPSYVSPSAASIVVDSYAVAGGVVSGTVFATTTTNLGPPACTTGSPAVCTVTVVAPIGSATFGITIYSGPNAGGSALSSVRPSASLATTIAADAANVVPPLALGGVPASIVVTATGPIPGGTATSLPVTVTARDAGGNLIVGSAPYANPIALTGSDASISFSGPVGSPASAVNLQSNGNSLAGNALSVTLGATAAGVSAGNVTGTTLTWTPAALTAGCPACSGLTPGSSPYAQTISEPGYSGPITLTTSGAHCHFNPATALTMSGGSATVFVYPNPQGGSCTVQATDAYAQSSSASPSFAAVGPPGVGGTCTVGAKPPDPYGGFLYVNNCASVVTWGTYTILALDSSANPAANFVSAIYATTSGGPVRSFANACQRYISSATINTSTSNIDYVGQSGTCSIAWTSFLP